jgi:hypothetical protein
VKITLSVGRSIIEAEGADTKECFAQLAQSGEIFGINKCGLCDSHDVVPVVRESKGYTFYEWKCTSPSCGASLSLGQRKSDGCLFPKTREGWKKWANTNPADDSGDDPF